MPSSPRIDFPLSSPVLDSWRAAGGERLTFSEVGWTGAATALVLHATLHFFSVPIPSLESLLVAFAPVERVVFALTQGASPIATWMALLIGVAVWGALVGVALLAAAHKLTDQILRLLRY